MSTLPIRSRNAVAAPRASAPRRAVWLLLGWFAFWLPTVVYPCQAHHAPPVTLGGQVAMEIDSGTHADAGRPDSSPAHDIGICQELTAPTIATPVAVVASTGTLNPDPPAPAAFEVKRLVAALHGINAYPGSRSLPHTPLYLRVQRLLI